MTRFIRPHRTCTALRRLAVGTAIVFAALPLAARAADDSESDPEKVRWSRLTYKASKFLITATTQVELRYEAPDEADLAQLAQEPGSEVQPAGSDLAVIRLNARFLNKDSTDEVWIDSRDGRALQRKKLESGKDKYRKTIRYGRNGIRTLRAAPQDKTESDAAPDEWSRTQDTRYDYPAEAGDLTVSVPAGLFYLLAATKLEPGEKHRIHASAGKGLALLEIEAHEPVTIKTRYHGPGDTQRKGQSREVQAPRITVATQAVDPEGHDFEFLGLEGDLELFLDPKTRAPLQVSGRASSLGRIDVKLTELVLR